MIAAVIHYIDRQPTSITDPDFHQALVEKINSMVAQDKMIKKIYRYNTKFFNVERMFIDINSALEWKEFILEKAKEFDIRLAGIDFSEPKIFGKIN